MYQTETKGLKLRDKEIPEGYKSQIFPSTCFFGTFSQKDKPERHVCFWKMSVFKRDFQIYMWRIMFSKHFI